MDLSSSHKQHVLLNLMTSQAQAPTQTAPLTLVAALDGYSDTVDPIDSPPSSPVSSGSLCNSTPDPSYCKSILPNQTSNVYDYGRFSVRKSLSQSSKFLNLVDNYLARRSSLSISAIRVLEDCRLLADGLQDTASAWSVKNGLLLPLSNDTKLYSVSLALFTKGWVPKKKKSFTWQPTRKQLAFGNGRLPLKMSSRTRTIFESVSRRKLLQTAEEDAVLVSDIVTRLLHDFITAGVYEEYVSIPKNKKYLLMVGAGINQTVITGNRSVVDGWTTFNSATFAVVAPNFVGVNITFRNTAGAIKHQAVALRNGADLSTFYSCSFEGYQDTLYTHSLRQFYRECDIYGTVDFIFGNAAVVFQNCNLYPRLL
ncbi:hypothetical protein GH714_023163 [Hevea brasiliensis]|uniref:Pectinesterase n=1 Tax=Hevea brasiliensis TaxID=3981 RepID=A0A6A6NIU6_HEVBR|nr:hypothetical protein GH714_023163 [Hevea brasiliensis]